MRRLVPPNQIRYGDARRPWSDEFIRYMNLIVDHPNYAGMPCTRDGEGKIDWTIPSNRSRGSKNWDGNVLRREWWAQRAGGLGIALEGEWISKTAKSIHPLGKKPCQTCGREMEIAYVYPTRATVTELNRDLQPTDQLIYEDFLPIDDVVTHIYATLGNDARSVLLRVFAHLEPEDVVDASGATRAIREKYCRVESGKFSPGAMSNPPDRLDGFHTYNLCCRGKQDTGRTSQNLRSYGVDRRAYEQWCEGDWAAADLLMTQAGSGRCANCGRIRQLTADHIGPISIGFSHSPDMRPLCKSCNSAKNNRMDLRDVRHLLDREKAGYQAVSWQARSLWNACKRFVTSDRDALLLSKLLRINQHHYLMALYSAVALGVPDVIQQLLQPQHALYRIEFVDLDRSTLAYRTITRLPRQDTYARMRASRMMRVAYDSLNLYARKSKRNVQAVSDDLVRGSLQAYLDSLKEIAAARAGRSYRSELIGILEADLPDAVRDERLAAIDAFRRAPDCSDVRRSLTALMDAYASVLNSRFARHEAVNWDDAVFDD